MTRIPAAELSENWFGFIHSVIAKLQAAHRESGLSQKEIGERLGRAPAVISRCLSGQQNMTMRTMYELARGMGYRIEVKFQRLDKLQRANRQPPSVPTGKSGTASTAILFGPEPEIAGSAPTLSLVQQ
jgi:transcriptional regulator with XRE-family HTH domain